MAIRLRELNRLNFIEKRDGKEAMLKFAEQGLKQYESALSTNYGKTYWDELMVSIQLYNEKLNLWNTYYDFNPKRT
jgi:hypothetical protein